MTRAITKAVWFDAPNSASVREETLLPAGEGDVTVQTILSGISPGTELAIYRGQGSKEQRVDPKTCMGESMGSFPIKFGYQNVGRVAFAGARSGFSVGDLVLSRFPHQAMFTTEADPLVIYRIPENIDAETAVFANLLVVALNALLDAPVRLGDVVAVHGLGIMGLFCAQLAAKTSPHVIAFDPSPARRAVAQRLGIRAAASAQEAHEEILRRSNGRGADLSFEVSGAPAALQNAIRSTGVEGTIAVVSWYGSQEVKLVLSPEFHERRLKIISSHISSISPDLQPRWNPARRMDVVWDLLPTLHARELITHRVPFERAQEAYQLFANGGDALGVVLNYSHPNSI
jgi:2-desacetyl-2-hydroxyethyl bacteriochlorophyllide A dehydrogenase